MVFEFKFKTKRSDERGYRGWGIACDDNVINIKEKIDYCSVVEVEEQRGICRGLEPKTSLIPGDCASLCLLIFKTHLEPTMFLLDDGGTEVQVCCYWRA